MSLVSLDRYAFINAKLRSRIGSMLETAQIEQLMKSQTLEELLHALRSTPYEPLLEIYDESGDVQRLEAWLFARNVALHQEVAKFMKGIHEKAVLAMTRKLEVENLKSVIRLWFSNTVKHQNIDYRFGYLYQDEIVSNVDWTQIVNASGYDGILEAVEGSPYASAVSSFSTEQVAQEGLFGLETALDRTWIAELHRVVAQLPPKDRSLTEQVLHRDADLKNIINLVRFGWMYQLPQDQLRTLMLEGSSLVETKEFEAYLETPPSARSPEKLVAKRFPDLSKLLRDSGKSTPEEQTRLVEQYLFSVRKQSFHAMLQGDPFSFGTILSYFFLEERQDAIIRILINGIHYGWESQEIREFVL